VIASAPEDVRVVGSVFWYDEVGDEFVPVSGEVVPLPSRVEGVAVALPGARLAWFDGSATVHVLLFGEGPIEPERVDLDLAGDLPPLTGIAAGLTPDGRVVVSGLDESGTARAMRIDVGRATVEELSDGTLPSSLVVLEDGTLVELSTEGAVLRRTTLRNEFDAVPATLLPEDTDWLSFDAAPRWAPQGPAMRAETDGAAVDVPTFTAADVSVTVSAQGPITLWLRSGGLRAPVVMSGTEVRQGLCALSHPADADVTIERVGNQVLLIAAEARKPCTVIGLDDRVSLSLTAPRGTILNSLQIERL
jgi:hypothetical protein